MKPSTKAGPVTSLESPQASLFLKPRLTLLLALSLTALISACGSDSEQVPPVAVVEPDVPTAAATSIPALISFATLKTNSPEESAEPIDVGTNDLASSDTDEPDANV